MKWCVFSRYGQQYPPAGQWTSGIKAAERIHWCRLIATKIALILMQIMGSYYRNKKPILQYASKDLLVWRVPADHDTRQDQWGCSPWLSSLALLGLWDSVVLFIGAAGESPPDSCCAPSGTAQQPQEGFLEVSAAPVCSEDRIPGHLFCLSYR